MRNPERDRVRHYYRALVIVAMRGAGHSLRDIAGYFLISHQRVVQILKRGPIPAQLELPCDLSSTSK